MGRRGQVGTPLASGRLAGGSFYGQKDESPTALTVKGIEQVCARFGVDIKAVRLAAPAPHMRPARAPPAPDPSAGAQAALQFPLAHPRTASIIPGASNAAEAAMNKGLLDAKIPGGLWRALKEGGLLRGDAPTPLNPDGKL